MKGTLEDDTFQTLQKTVVPATSFAAGLFRCCPIVPERSCGFETTPFFREPTLFCLILARPTTTGPSTNFQTKGGRRAPMTTTNCRPAFIYKTMEIRNKARSNNISNTNNKNERAKTTILHTSWMDIREPSAWLLPKTSSPMRREAAHASRTVTGRNNQSTMTNLRQQDRTTNNCYIEYNQCVGTASRSLPPSPPPLVSNVWRIEYTRVHGVQEGRGGVIGKLHLTHNLPFPTLF